MKRIGFFARIALSVRILVAEHRLQLLHERHRTYREFLPEFIQAEVARIAEDIDRQRATVDLLHRERLASGREPAPGLLLATIVIVMLLLAVVFGHMVPA